MRLTNAMKDDLIQMAIEHAIPNREDKKKKLLLAFSREWYKTVYGPFIEQMNELPDSFFEFRSGFTVRIGEYRTYVQFEESVKTTDFHWNQSDEKVLAKLKKLFEDYTEQENKIKEKVQQIEILLKGLFANCNTVKQLREAWPEGAVFIDKLSPEAKTNFPAVKTEEINKLLGLP